MEIITVVGPVVEEVARLLTPKKIYLYNQKHNPKGEFTAFKLCVVADLPDKEEAEREVYRRVDCDIPFDVLLYTPPEWEELTEDPSSFASHIMENGTVVYG